jgi:hypothetical protein
MEGCSWGGEDKLKAKASKLINYSMELGEVGVITTYCKEFARYLAILFRNQIQN